MGDAIGDETGRASLGEVVASAPADEKGSTSGRARSRRRWVIAAGVAGVVAIAVLAVVLPNVLGGHDEPPALGTPDPGFRPVGDRPEGVPMAQLPVESALSDGTSLTLYGTGGGCSIGEQAEVLEKDDQVIVRILDFLPQELADAEPGSYACPAVAKLLSIEVSLAAPLGDRPLIDDSSGEQVAVVDGSVILRPGDLPPGWQEDRTGIQVSAPAGPVVSIEYSHPTEGYLSIQQGPVPFGELTNPDFYGEIGTADVNGHPATWGTAGDSLELYWQQDGQGFHLLSGGLTLDDLLQIALSLS